MTGTDIFLGICEVFRFIYDKIEDMEDEKLRDEISELLVDAMFMAKKMNKRMRYYRDKYGDFTGSGGKNLKHVPGDNSRRKMRKMRVV